MGLFDGPRACIFCNSDMQIWDRRRRPWHVSLGILMAGILLRCWGVRRRSNPMSEVKDKPKAPTNPRQPEPTPPFPEQHQEKPGIESKLDPRPHYQAED